MNIQPPAALVSLAGTQRAAVRSGDAQNTAAQAAGNQQRTENPAGRGEKTTGVEAGDGASDGEPDGRQSWQQQQQPEDQPAPPAREIRRRQNPEGTGGQVDFDA